MANEEGKSLQGKIALVTGGSRGIGRAVASAYLREGARVFICARNEPELDGAVGEMRRLGGEIAGCGADVGQAEDVKRLVETTVHRFGGLHILVNNAGIVGPRAAIKDYPLDAWQEVIGINLTGVFLLTQEVLKVMIPERRGSIINVSSGVGRSGRARWGAYAVSKFGVEGLTQVLADEVKHSGIRVNSVNPGATRTAMRASAYPDEDPKQLPAPEEITGVFLHLASDASVGTTGAALDAQEWRRRAGN